MSCMVAVVLLLVLGAGVGVWLASRGTPSAPLDPEWERQLEEWKELPGDAWPERAAACAAQASAALAESNRLLEAAWNPHQKLMDGVDEADRPRLHREGAARMAEARSLLLEAARCAEEITFRRWGTEGSQSLAPLVAPLGQGTWQRQVVAAAQIQVHLEVMVSAITPSSVDVSAWDDFDDFDDTDDVPDFETFDHLDGDALLERARAAGLPIPKNLDPLKRDHVVSLLPSLLGLHQQLPEDPNLRAGALMYAASQGGLSVTAARWLWPTELVGVPTAWRALEMLERDPGAAAIVEEFAEALAVSGGEAPELSHEPWRALLERMHWNALAGPIGAEALAELEAPLERDAPGVALRMAAWLVCDQWATATIAGDAESAWALRTFVLQGPMGNPGVFEPSQAGRVFDRTAPDPGQLAQLQWSYEGATALAWALGLLPDLPDTVERQDLRPVVEQLPDLDPILAVASLRETEVLHGMRDTLRARYRRRHREAMEQPTHDAHMLRSRAGERWKALEWLLEGPEAHRAASAVMSSDLMPQA